MVEPEDEYTIPIDAREAFSAGLRIGINIGLREVERFCGEELTKLEHVHRHALAHGVNIAAVTFMRATLALINDVRSARESEGSSSDGEAAGHAPQGL